MHHKLVVVYRRFEMAYQGPSYNPSTASHLGPIDRVFKYIVQQLLTHCATTQNSEELISALHRKEAACKSPSGIEDTIPAFLFISFS